MTASEIKKQYDIPETVLRICEEQVRKIHTGKRTEELEYSDFELDEISKMITLLQFGFGEKEIGDFFGLEKKGQMTKTTRLKMLKKQRNRILDEIHQKEKILGELDYLVYGLS